MSVALAAALLGPVLVLIGGVLLGHRLWRHRRHPRTGVPDGATPSLVRTGVEPGGRLG